MKQLFRIVDEFGQVGFQISATPCRAIYLWANKHNGGDVTGLKAVSFANDNSGDGWEPEDEDAWKKADDALVIASRRAL